MPVEIRGKRLKEWGNGSLSFSRPFEAFKQTVSISLWSYWVQVLGRKLIVLWLGLLGHEKRPSAVIVQHCCNRSVRLCYS